MTKIIYSARARRELLQIIEMIAADNASAANVFADRVERHCSLLATTPEMGRPRPDVGPGVRSLVRGNYLIFYRWRSALDRVEILSVRHGSRRLPRLRRRTKPD